MAQVDSRVGVSASMCRFGCRPSSETFTPRVSNFHCSLDRARRAPPIPSQTFRRTFPVRSPFAWVHRERSLPEPSNTPARRLVCAQKHPKPIAPAITPRHCPRHHAPAFRAGADLRGLARTRAAPLDRGHTTHHEPCAAPARSTASAREHRAVDETKELVQLGLPVLQKHRLRRRA